MMIGLVHKSGHVEDRINEKLGHAYYLYMSLVFL